MKLPPCYVLDTGYLDELWRVESYYKDEKHAAIKDRFNVAYEAGADFIVPIPVLFELANHITQGKNADRRRLLTEQFEKSITSSLNSDLPWHIEPNETGVLFANLTDALQASVDRFAREFAEQKISLTDTAVCLTAERFKATNNSRRVHIWTVDRALKALEPDREPDPYL
jgi:hypothetical protein